MKSKRYKKVCLHRNVMTNSHDFCSVLLWCFALRLIHQQTIWQDNPLQITAQDQCDAAFYLWNVERLVLDVESIKLKAISLIHRCFSFVLSHTHVCDSGKYWVVSISFRCRRHEMKKKIDSKLKSGTGVSVDYHNSIIFISIHLMGFYFNASVIELCLILLLLLLLLYFTPPALLLVLVHYTVIWYECSLFETFPFFKSNGSNTWHDNNFITRP